MFQDFKACYFKSQSQANVILADSDFRRIYYYTFILYIWLHFRHEGSCTPHSTTEIRRPSITAGSMSMPYPSIPHRQESFRAISSMSSFWRIIPLLSIIIACLLVTRVYGDPQFNPELDRDILDGTIQSIHGGDDKGVWKLVVPPTGVPHWVAVTAPDCHADNAADCQDIVDKFAEVSHTPVV